ncbi:MAG: DUF4139 domain-containing protein [Desulfobacteraceae bacterium]|jgi:hypothetical protein
MKKQGLTWMICAAILLMPIGSTAGPVLQSDIQDQEAVEVTVYNNNLGLIKDVRTVSLPVGEGELRFMDVASHVHPATVHVISLEASSEFAVLEQNYEYDLMNAQKLLDKYVGKEIKIVDWNPYQDRKDTVDATLLSNNQGQVYRIGKDIYLGHPGIKVLPELPEDLIAKPTLTWLFRNENRNPHRLQVSYLTGNIQWRADYVLLLNDTDTQGNLSGWVTLDNRSGATYRNARLKLIAGAVHRVSPAPQAQQLEAKAMARPGADGFVEEALFEYHMYDLERRTTIKDRQTKQIRLLEAPGVEVQKELCVFGSRHAFTRNYQGRPTKTPVTVYVTFQNEDANHLGIPLPAGVVRLYKQDSRGSQQFIGEDRIEHTPKDEAIRLKTGEAFDVVSERLQTDYRQVTRGVHETAWEIRLRNHKESPVRIAVVEPLAGRNWKILESSHPYEKSDAFTIRFEVDVPPDESVSVRYRVQIGF